MSEGILLDKPIVVTFRALASALVALHQNDRRWLASLHDVWKLGAPAPDSRILNPKGYDERLKQDGNYEARIVFPTALARWVQDVSAARGMPLEWRQCLNMAEGRADYGVDFHAEPLLVMDMGKHK